MFDSQAKVAEGIVSNDVKIMPFMPQVISSLGGCVVHDVAKTCAGPRIEVRRHFWRRPTIALMSNPVERSRFKLHEIPSPFVNYFVNDITKIHQAELAAAGSAGGIVIDITRDIFTGVLDLGGGCYIMNPADGVGIVDGLSKETMGYDILRSILGFDPKAIGYERDGDEFLELWKLFFLRKLDFLTRAFGKVVLLEIYFTPNLVGGHVEERLVEGADKANAMLADMYAFARDKNLTVVSLERSAFQTGHFVPWGGPSLTHFVPETLARLADRVSDVIAPSGDDERRLVRQAYRRAGQHEQAMRWLNAEKAKRADLESRLQDMQRDADAQTTRADGEVRALQDRCRALEAELVDRDAERDAERAAHNARLEAEAQRIAELEARIADEARRRIAAPSAYARARKGLARTRRRCLRAMRLSRR